MEIQNESSLSIVPSLSTTTELSHLCSSESPSWTPEEQTTLRYVHRVRVVVCYLALVTNGIIFLFQMRLKSFMKTYFVFGLSLTIADLIFSVGSLLKTYSWVLPSRSWPDPLLLEVVITAGHFHAYVSAFLITVDRYLALVWDPLRYKSLVSLKLYYIIFALSCCFSSLYSFILRYFLPPYHYLSSLNAFMIPSIAMVTCTLMYIKMYLAIPHLPATPYQENNRHKQSKKLLLAILLILVASIVTSLPMEVFHFYLFLDTKRFEDFKNILIANIFYTLQITSAVVNPIIYWWQVLLKEVQPLCHCLRTKICG